MWETLRPPVAVDVWVRLGDNDIRVGTIDAKEPARGRQTYLFTYAADYLAHPGAYAIDPALPLIGARPQRTDLQGAFSDARPDRWGTRLIRRAFEAELREAGLPLRTLTDLDVLLGVEDEARMGALRFALPGGAFLRVSSEPIPPVIDLPHLAALARRAEDDDETPDELRELLRAGSSLGGARPKATVREPGGGLALAKFASVADEYDIVGWEAVALDVAQAAGVRVPAHRSMRVAGRSALLLDRFDRAGDGARTPYLSAMSLLGAHDGDERSYVEIAEALNPDGAPDPDDLHELFRRACLGLLIGNTDDHLRNHGVLRGPDGWRLSPAFDLNPGTAKTAHATAIHPGEPDSVPTLLKVADAFALRPDQARDVVRTTRTAVAGWRDVAARHRLPAREIERMAAAFEDGTRVDE